MNVSEFKVLKLTKEEIQMEQSPFLKKTPLTAKLQPVINIVYLGEGRVFSIQVAIFSGLGQGCGCENKTFLFPEL